MQDIMLTIGDQSTFDTNTKLDRKKIFQIKMNFLDPITFNFTQFMSMTILIYNRKHLT